MAPVPPRALDHVLMSDEELTIDEQSEGGGEGSGGEAGEEGEEGEEGAETEEDPSQREVKWGLPDGLMVAKSRQGLTTS